MDSNFARGAATWRTLRNITLFLILLNWTHYMKRRHPQNRKPITYCIVVKSAPIHGHPQITCKNNFVKFGFLLRPRERLYSIVMSMSVCVCVCLREDVSGTTRAIFINFLCMLPVTVAWSSSGRVTKSQEERAVLWVFPIDNALYSIAFRTHTKTAEPIEMPFGTMSGLGPWNSMQQSPKGRGKFEENMCPTSLPLWIANWTGPCSGVHTMGADSWCKRWTSLLSARGGWLHTVGEVWYLRLPCWNMPEDRQTDKQTNRHTDTLMAIFRTPFPLPRAK